MTLWFSATAIVPSLAAEFELTGFRVSLFTSAVQVGFVVGSLTSAVLGLADRIDPRRFFFVCAVAAALANGAILILDPTSNSVIFARFATGVCMAGIYPVGMKIAASWARGGPRGDMGMVVGLLVGALTLGSAAPHFFNAAGGVDWRLTLVVSSLAALCAALTIFTVRLGPNIAPAPKFNPALAMTAWRNKPLRLANIGYLGHMWELYAMWAWIGVFLHASFAIRWAPEFAGRAAGFASFAVIAVGAFGCLAGGFLADRIGRTTLTMAALAVSGACAICVGFLFGGNPWILVVLCLVWGVAVIADSAQFSASIAELSDSSVVGTMLTLQTALGFTLTLVTIHLMPIWVDAIGWRYAFSLLALGPVLGIVAMARLRVHPAAAGLAGGRR
jgi:MFS family permease